MDGKTDHKRVTAIVPAYNEADRIGAVLDVLCSYTGFEEVIVVDDGSTDHTPSVIDRYPVRYIRHETNRGKGGAMDTGVTKAQGDIICFFDADVTGLTHTVIDQIIAPVMRGDVEMFIGMRNRKIFFLHELIAFIPLLSGERALTKELWNKLPDFYKHRFRIEAALNFYATYYGKGFRYKIFKGIRQVIKEKKYGFFTGLKFRLAMTWHIITAQCALQFKAIPRSARNKRFLAFISLHSLMGAAIGLLITAGARYVPQDVFRSIFFIGGLIIFATNMLIFFMTFKKLSFLIAGISRKMKNHVD